VSERCVALFCGSRDWADAEAILRAINALPGHAVVIHGGQRGADRIAGNLADLRGLHVATIYPQWDRFHGEAGPRRNDALMALLPTVGYAYPLPQSRGTWDMVRKLRAAEVPVFVAGQPVA
jgi:hypothetical protein